ncbi:TPA: phage portal protein [Streptococcus suis]
MTETTHHADDILEEGQYIPRSYQFERDMEPTTLEKREDFLQFSDKANVHFMFHSAKKLVEKDKEPKDLKKMVASFFGDQIERLKILEDYSNGNNFTILKGRKRLEPEKADYRIRHDLGGQASRFFTGYTVGQPISIGSSETNLDLKSVDNFNSYNDIEAINRELVYDASRFGRAFELHYFDEFEQPAVVLIDAKEMFTVRSADVKKEIIAAVHCPIYNGEMFVTVYTDEEIVRYDNNWKETDRKPNPFNMVPVVEWQNNRERLGDWEKGIPIIDAYDAAESDTANYMSDLNDAMLVIKGDVASTGMNASDIMQMKQANMLVLESGVGHNGQQTNLEAGYIYKQYDVSGVEAYKSRLIKDFFRIVGLPNLQDDATFSATSGIAIRYKLVDLQQVTSVKRGFFVKALKRRYKLLQSLSENLKGFEAVNANLLTFTFHENLPTDVWAEIQSAINSGMDISQETLMESASFTDARKEKSRLLKEGGASDIEISQIVGDTNVGQADNK